MFLLNIKNIDFFWIWFADIPSLPMIFVSKIFNIPAIITVGGFEIVEIKDINYGNQLKPIRGWISRWIIKNATAVIVPSPPYETIIKNLVPTANVYMIPHFIDKTKYNKYFWEKDNLVVTSVWSKFAYECKGIPIFKRMSESIPQETKIIEQWPRELYEIILKRAKVYCQFSREDSSPISLIEAMSYGCVPVVSDKGGLPWIVGDAGIVVPYGDVEKTINTINIAMTMDGSESRKRAQYFSRGRKQKLIKEMLLKEKIYCNNKL